MAASPETFLDVSCSFSLFSADAQAIFLAVDAACRTMPRAVTLLSYQNCEVFCGVFKIKTYKSPGSADPQSDRQAN